MRRAALIAGGGSGSHIYPGLRVASELSRFGVEPHWLGAQGGPEKAEVGGSGIDLTLVEVEGLHGLGTGAALRAAGHLPRAVAEAVSLILRVRPFVVLGVGGYASAAGLLAAGMLGLPMVLQEHNALPGWVNQALAPWADLVCCGFSEVVEAFPAAEWTGVPVREGFFEIEEVEPPQPPRILILCGSRGSLFLNRVVPRALSELKKRGLEPKIHHQAGTRWSDVVRTGYEDLGIDATVSSVLSEPWRLMAEVDLVLARSGALTVAELAAAGRGAILVPFAQAAGNYQEFNARAMERAGGAVVLTEREATADRVADVLADLLGNAGRLEALGRAARSMARPQAAQRIASRVMAIGGAA